jgi:hypothetical protein
MCSKEHIYKIYSEKSIKFKTTDSYEKLSEYVNASNIELFSIEDFTKLSRSMWKHTDLDFHIQNLKSGKLNGHDWHGAMPSMLHLSLQDRVRDCIQGKINIDQLITIGSDIMKHEYFMVAAHDLAEATIINHFKDSIPPTSNKSISDFVFKGIPYDLKNTNPIMGFSKEEINKNKEEVIQTLLKGADISRIREQAKRTLNNWGLNRFYFIVQDQNRWLNEPEKLLEELVIESTKLEEPYVITIDNIKILCQLISI